MTVKELLDGRTDMGSVSPDDFIEFWSDVMFGKDDLGQVEVVDDSLLSEEDNLLTAHYIRRVASCAA